MAMSDARIRRQGASSDWQFHFKRFVRLRLKPTLEFDGHLSTSLMRDLGSLEKAQKRYREEMTKLEFDAFSGDFALLNAPDQDVKEDKKTINLPDLRLKCETQLITTNQAYNRLLLLTTGRIFFDSSDGVLWIPLETSRRFISDAIG
jgi:hypothetical protein